jgi:beta-lactam-binding protein with PASTA domain
MRSPSQLQETVAGRYRITARIASGGMGEVFRAWDVRLRRTVALKVLPPELAGDPRFVERFRSEAQAAGGLSHPNVVQVHDWGETDSTYYMVLEYVRGRNLRQILATKSRLAPRQACELMVQVLEALEAAHARGLVHRDVKPENILVTTDGRAKVTDFGIARAKEAAVKTGGLLGTVAYVAPEQARDGEIDSRSDIYSAGCVLYELLVGVMPFEGDAAEVLNQHLSGRVSPPSLETPDVSAELDAVVAKATQPDPNDRYESAAAMRADLERALMTMGNSSPLSELVAEVTSEVAASSLETVVPIEERKRRRWRLIFGAALLLAAAVLGFFFRPTKVPAVAGRKAPEAERLLQQRGFDVRARYLFADEEAETVIGSQPPAGRWILRGQTVALDVSMGPALADLPSLVGLPLEEAKRSIAAAGLIVGQESQRHDRAPAGQIIDQDPKAGRVRKSSPVNLVVSLGPEMVSVPEVGGKPLGQAQSVLRDAGLESVVEEAWSDAPEGTVVGQDPKPGASVEKGSQVRLVVSKGPEPFAMPDVRGKACSDAKSELEGRGLAVAVNSRSSSGCGGNKVVEQDPLPGMSVRKGSEATLYVS